MLSKARGKRFQLILIKPSHYDADGYVVQWLRSTMPSNSLAAVYSLALGAATREVLGPRQSMRPTPGCGRAISSNVSPATAALG